MKNKERVIDCLQESMSQTVVSTCMYFDVTSSLKLASKSSLCMQRSHTTDGFPDFYKRLYVL
jgi:hypothetical protein